MLSLSDLNSVKDKHAILEQRTIQFVIFFIKWKNKLYFIISSKNRSYIYVEFIVFMDFQHGFCQLLGHFCDPWLPGIVWYLHTISYNTEKGFEYVALLFCKEGKQFILNELSMVIQTLSENENNCQAEPSPIFYQLTACITYVVLNYHDPTNLISWK